ncbi:MAG TPA: hypothetical protein VGI43_01395 [Mucilaginibacter sp.]
MKKTLLTISFIAITYCGFAQSQVVTTGNNVVNPANPMAADIVIGSNAGTRHDASIMWWSNASASRISNTADVFYLSTWSTTNPNIALSATVGGTSWFQGSLGVGTTSPQTSLHLVGAGTSVDANYQYTGGGLIVQGNTGSRSSSTGAQLEFVIPANTDGTNLWGQARIITVAGNANSGDATGKMIMGTRRSFNKTGAGVNWYYGNDLTIDGNGFIGINTTNTFGYQLAINGTAIATSMTVKAYANWPDYVFKKNYILPTLSSIKTYIDQNHHLPEIPSAQQIEKDGLNLGDMNKALLKKVEELTLYLIEKDKKEKEQDAKLKQLEDRLKILESTQNNK